MQSIIKIILAYVCLLIFVNGCSPSTSIESPINGCKTIHYADKVDLVSSKKTRIKIPVSYESNEKGFTTIVIPVIGTTDKPQINANVIFKSKSGWQSEKDQYPIKNQVVVYFENTPSEFIIDFSPNFKIFKGERRILVLNISINSFPINLQPVIADSYSYRGFVDYTTENNGNYSSFTPLENLFSGEPISNELSVILDKTETGTCLIPDYLSSPESIIKENSTSANLKLCPPSKQPIN